MSRELELAFTSPIEFRFRCSAGLAFYDRAEIRDLLAYLRLIENPVDVVAVRANRQSTGARHRQNEFRIK